MKIEQPFLFVFSLTFYVKYDVLVFPLAQWQGIRRGTAGKHRCISLCVQAVGFRRWGKQGVCKDAHIDTGLKAVIHRQGLCMRVTPCALGLDCPCSIPPASRLYCCVTRCLFIGTGPSSPPGHHSTHKGSPFSSGRKQNNMSIPMRYQ